MGTIARIASARVRSAATSLRIGKAFFWQSLRDAVHKRGAQIGVLTKF
jgi:hypothetical protein